MKPYQELIIILFRFVPFILRQAVIHNVNFSLVKISARFATQLSALASEQSNDLEKTERIFVRSRR